MTLGSNTSGHLFDTSFTTNGVIYSAASGVMTSVAAGTTGQVLSGNTGSAPSWATAALGDVVGPASSTDNALVRFDLTTGKLIQNGVITEDDTGNLSITASVTGANLSAIVSNTSNTASAQAFYQAQVAGSTAADAYYVANISGGQGYSFGVDNSDSDAFVLSATVTPGTTNVMRVSTAGEINYPLQPAFFAYQASGATNATGSGENYQLGSTVDLTEVFDQGGDFVPTTGTFTAPVTGRYRLETTTTTIGGTAQTQVDQYITTSNNNFRSRDTYGAAAVVGGSAPSKSILCDMDAADTALVTIGIVASGGTVVQVYGAGGSEAWTTFSGNLVC